MVSLSFIMQMLNKSLRVTKFCIYLYSAFMYVVDHVRGKRMKHTTPRGRNINCIISDFLHRFYNLHPNANFPEVDYKTCNIFLNIQRLLNQLSGNINVKWPIFASIIKNSYKYCKTCLWSFAVN